MMPEGGGAPDAAGGSSGTGGTSGGASDAARDSSGGRGGAADAAGPNDTGSGLDAASQDGSSRDVTVDRDPGRDAPGAADSGRTWWQPAPGTTWQIQLAGTLDTSVAALAFDVDMFDVEVSTIADLTGKGKKIICYFSAGSHEDWRSDAAQFPKEAIGKGLGWPGESWLDTRSTGVRAIMLARLDLAAKKGCHAVDPDNVDGYLLDTGFPLTKETAIDYTRFLADAAHARGIAVGLKNDEDLVAELLPWFDFAVNEECVIMKQCQLLDPFVAAGKAVFDIEYGDASLVSAVCPPSNARNFDTIIKKLELDAFRVACR
jgi:hypothetical protein